MENAIFGKKSETEPLIEVLIYVRNQCAVLCDSVFAVILLGVVFSCHFSLN